MALSSRWGAYTNLTQVFRDPETGKLSQMNNVICGLGAGVCEAVCAVTPVETVKTRVTDDQRRGTGNYKGSADAIVKIMKSEGPMGLYRGSKCIGTSGFEWNIGGFSHGF